MRDTFEDQFPGRPYPPFQLTKTAMAVKLLCWSCRFPEVKL